MWPARRQRNILDYAQGALVHISVDVLYVGVGVRAACVCACKWKPEDVGVCPNHSPLHIFEAGSLTVLGDYPSTRLPNEPRHVSHAWLFIYGFWG